jgi:aminoglycoside phosphotransferase (APT) family kinase protein
VKEIVLHAYQIGRTLASHYPVTARRRRGVRKRDIPVPGVPASRTDDSDAAEAATRLAAQLMRAIGQEITQRIVPELTSADALERANFARLVLQNLAADLDVLPRAAAKVAPALRRAIAATLAAADGVDPVLEECRARLSGIREETGAGMARELSALRDLAGQVLRRLSDGSDAAGRFDQPALHAAVAELGRCDADWIAGYDDACAAEAGALTPDAAPGQSVAERVSIDNFNAYLRRRFPSSADAVAADLVPIPGGRSKKTFFVRISGVDALPGNLVMRQDFALKYAGTRVADEYRPLLALADLGLPVPRPFHLENESSELGPPFMLVERLRGRAPGTYFGISTPCPAAFRDLAAMLAKLHRVEPATLGMERASDGTDSMRQLIGQYQAKWRENATRASPVVDYAYGWALRECGRDPGRTAVVHGDAGPYNLLVDDDRLTAVLDWEFAHAGDPAEDLGIARVYADSFMSWEEFMQAYHGAGGPEVPESRIRLGMLIQFLKGTTLVAASGRNFRDGGTRDFIKGANSFTGLRLIERKIADILRRFEAF